MALLLFLGALWGIAFMFISLGFASFSPLLFAAVRFDLTALALLVVALARRALLVPAGGRERTAIAVNALFTVAGYHGLLFWGQQFTTAGIAAVIVGLNPVLTTAFSRVVLAHERLRARGVLGLALGFAGIAILASLKPGSLLDARGVGELAVVGGIGAFSLGSVLVTRTGHRMDTFAFLAWSFAGGAALLHLASWLLEPAPRAVLDASGVVSIVYLSLVSSAFGFVVYFTLLRRVGPIRVNLVSYISPVFATLSGALVLGEALELRALLAFALIAVSFGLVTRAQ